MARVRSNWSAIAKKPGFSKILKVKFLPGSLCQRFCCCPRPAYWLSAIMTVPSGNGLDFDKVFLRKLFVESISFKVIKF